MKTRMTTVKRRALAQERKALDRALLRFLRTLYVTGPRLLDEVEQRELLGLVRARRRLS